MAIAETRTAGALDRWVDFELGLCRDISRNLGRPFRELLSVVSHLGDGWIWYAIGLVTPLVLGDVGAYAVLHMLIMGLTGSAIYSAIKRLTARSRPCDTPEGPSAVVAPLDRYSFPSGHTLHAVGHTIVLFHHLPFLAWPLLPFAVLVALSRVALGLHYPTDVLAGGTLGAVLAFVVV